MATARAWARRLHLALGRSGLSGPLRRIGDKHARRVTIGHFPGSAPWRRRASVCWRPAPPRRKAVILPLIDGGRARVSRRWRRSANWPTCISPSAPRAASCARKPSKWRRVPSQRCGTALGDRLLADIETQDIATVIRREESRLRKAGRTGRSANIALGVVKQMFRFAKQEGYFKAPSPAAELKRPTAERARARILFDGEILKPPAGEAADQNETGLLAVALADIDAPGPERFTRAALLLALMLGARAGEVAALQWSAVRLDDAPPTLTIVAGKTKAAARVLPLPAQAVAILRALKATDPRALRLSRSFRRRPRKASSSPKSLARAFTRLCVRLKIADATLHDLRRTALSAVVELTGDTGARRAHRRPQGRLDAGKTLRSIDAACTDARHAHGMGQRHR